MRTLEGTRAWSARPRKEPAKRGGRLGQTTLDPVRALLALCALLAATGCGGESERAAVAGWQELRPATLERTEVAAARVGRFVYVMGGFEPSRATSAATERYDIERDRWRRVADMPVALNHAAAVSYRGRVYVLGGYRSTTGLSEEVATLYRYDPGRDRWRRLPAAPTARAALAVGVIGGRLYAAGGADASGPLATLEIYDFARRRWRTGPDLATARDHLAGAVADGRFYVLAGRAAGHGNYAVVEAYDPGARRWRRVPAMRKPRGGIGAATVSGGRIVVAGGEESAGTIREVELYDPDTRRWSVLPDLPTPRHGLGVVARGRRVFTLEGGDRPGYAFTSTLEALVVPR
jgi:N-acetylneuraminic acid mutarotase